MSDFRCPECGKGMMEEQFIPNFKTKFEGVTIRVKMASIHQCNACGAKSYSAQELKRWKVIKNGYKPLSLQFHLSTALGLACGNFVFWGYVFGDFHQGKCTAIMVPIIYLSTVLVGRFIKNLKFF